MPSEILNKPSSNPDVEEAAQAGFRAFQEDDRRLHFLGGLSLQFSVAARNLTPVPSTNSRAAFGKDIVLEMQDGQEQRFLSYEAKVLAAMQDGQHSKVNLRKSYERFMNICLSKGYVLAIKVEGDCYLQKLSNPNHPNSGFNPV